ncbi:alanyl-tRNA editing protein [Aminobacterium sp. UBA5277]|uniref:alanyl-tRNA editing protein n=1 Tax=Aminobacterium sp. UBA5277 TaxID=1946029 RepID=UPI00257B0381|nr:alanyl-tRNA editing protein [Aminobacterium sp. UBA5277]
MKQHVFLKKIVSYAKKEAKVVIEPNPFHIAGGGQPGDTGHLYGENNFEATVLDCVKDGKEMILLIKVRHGELKEGVPVDVEVDMERQWLFSRMHSGEHVLSRALERAWPDLHIYKVAIGAEFSTVYLRYPGELSWEMLFRAEDEANLVIKQNLPVNISFLSPQEAMNMKELKANWERISDEETIRIVTIPDFDTIACSGTHVTKTSEIGGVVIEGFRGHSPEWEFRFSVHVEDVLKRESRAARMLLREIVCPLDKLQDVYRHLQEENKAFVKKMDRLRDFVAFPWKEERVGGVSLFWYDVSGIPEEVASSAVSRLLKERPDITCLFLLYDHGKGGSQFFLGAGEKVEVDFRLFLRDTSELKVRGGGQKSWVRGYTLCEDPSVWVGKIIDYMMSL